MTEPISPEVLAHYGVLGMKWGVRKDGRPQGYQGPSDGKPTRKQRRVEKKEAKQLRKKQKAWDKKNPNPGMDAYNQAADMVNSGKSNILNNLNKHLDVLYDKEGSNDFNKLSSSGRAEFDRLVEEYGVELDALITKKYNKIISSRPGY